MRFAISPPAELDPTLTLRHGNHDSASNGQQPEAEERQRRAVAAIEELERHKLPDGHYFCVEVIETLSQEATPLPEAWFSGEQDRRWRCNADGYHELIHGTPDPAD